MHRLVFFGLLYAGVAIAMPAQVILIRHGEKPAAGVHLSERGRMRARALVDFFLRSPEVTRFGTPVAIYASGTGGDDVSVRSIETVAPLASRLGLHVVDAFTKHEYEKLAREILRTRAFEGRTVLVAWEHKRIPDLAQELGCDQAPRRWSDETFDRVWVLTFREDGRVSFRDLPQHLLSGDSTH